MKRVWYVLGLLLVVSLGASAQTLDERIRDAKLQDAALRAVEESIAALEEQLSAPAELAAQMLAAPAAYYDPAASAALLREHERARLYDEFRTQLDRFASHLPELPPDWTARTLTAQQARIDQTIAPLLSARFNATFSAGRAAAVTAQANTIDADELLYPAPAEIEALVDPARLPLTQSLDTAAWLNTAPAQALVERYAAQVASEQALFAENRQALAGRIGAAMSQELLRLQDQLRLVQTYRADPTGPVEAGALEQAILAPLERNPGRGLFPGVRARARELGTVLEAELFALFVAGQLDPEQGCAGLPAAEVTAAIPADSARLPTSYGAHRDALAAELVASTEQRLVAAYGARLAEAATRAEFMQRLAARLQEDAAFRTALIRCLDGPLAAARAEVAAAEFAAARPALADGSFELDDATLTALRDLDEPQWPDALPPALAAVSDLHLDEARTLWQERTQALLAEGHAALETQLLLVERRREEFMTKIEQDPARATRREDWRQAYEEQVLADWQAWRPAAAARGELLTADKYDRLFAPTTALIDDLLPTDWAVQDTVAEPSPPPVPQDSACSGATTVCQDAGTLCYQALQDCAASGDCTGPLARCRDAKERCEEAQRGL